MKIVLIGLGNVGQGFISILNSKAEMLRQQYGLEVQITGVATRSRGTIYDIDGIQPDLLLQAITAGSLTHYPQTVSLRRDLDPLAMIQQPEVDVVIEVSPSNFQTGQPALDYCYTALNTKKHLILANKGPVVVDYIGLNETARQNGVGFYFEGTVMAGTPSIRLAMEALAGCTITRVRGILNGTTNYMLTHMENGMPYADALELAQQQGYAEADPTDDVEGWDAAGKLIILAAALFKAKLSLSSMKVTGISGVTSTNVELAQTEGERWKLIADATLEGGIVHPVRLPLTDPLTGVSGATNAITYTTDLLGDVTLIGAGAGRQQTGFAILADLLAVYRNYYAKS